MKTPIRIRSGLLALIALLAVPLAAHAEAGKVLFIYGTAHIEMVDGKRAALAKGDVVDSGDRVVTGSNGRVQIRMSDGGLLALRPQTEFIIEEYNYPRLAEGGSTEANQGEPRSFFTLVKGGFRSITGAIGKSDKSNYRVRTPVATIGIRGTDYTALLCSACPNAADGLYLGVAEGGVSLRNQGGSVDVDAGQFGFVADAASAPRLSEKAANVLAGGAAAANEAVAENDDDDQPNAPVVGATAMDAGGNAVSFTGGVSDSADDSGAVAFKGMGESGVAAAGRAAQANDAAGNLTGFTGNGETRFSVGSEQVVNVGRDVDRDGATDIRWGRWSGGDVQVDTAAGSSSENLGDDSVHWVAGNGPQPVVPATGSAEFALIGNTNPTDNQGNVGTLGSASLSADFTDQTVDAAVSLAFEETSEVWNASANDVDINSADATFEGAFDDVTVTNTSDQSSVEGSGDLSGFFSGNDQGEINGAGLGYSLSDGDDTTVSGAAAFQRTGDD